MTTAPQTITPERQIAASQIGQVFNSIHEYLSTLMHADADGRRLTSQPMEFARKAIEEASFWAIKHVLMHGVPAAPAAANDPNQPAADSQPAAETPAPIGVVDPVQPPVALPTDGPITEADIEKARSVLADTNASSDDIRKARWVIGQTNQPATPAESM